MLGHSSCWSSQCSPETECAVTRSFWEPASTARQDWSHVRLSLRGMPTSYTRVEVAGGANVYLPLRKISPLGPLTERVLSRIPSRILNGIFRENCWKVSAGISLAVFVHVSSWPCTAVEQTQTHRGQAAVMAASLELSGTVA